MDAQIGLFVYTRCHALESYKYTHACIGLLCTQNNPLKHLCVHKTPQRIITNI